MLKDCVPELYEDVHVVVEKQLPGVEVETVMAGRSLTGLILKYPDTIDNSTVSNYLVEMLDRYKNKIHGLETVRTDDASGVSIIKVFTVDEGTTFTIGITKQEIPSLGNTYRLFGDDLGEGSRAYLRGIDREDLVIQLDSAAEEGYTQYLIKNTKQADRIVGVLSMQECTIASITPNIDVGFMYIDEVCHTPAYDDLAQLLFDLTVYCAGVKVLYFDMLKVPEELTNELCQLFTQKDTYIFEYEGTSFEDKVMPRISLSCGCDETYRKNLLPGDVAKHLKDGVITFYIHDNSKHKVVGDVIVDPDAKRVMWYSFDQGCMATASDWLPILNMHLDMLDITEREELREVKEHYGIL